MNKNFEDAYKAEVQQNIPDLWNRIESSLPQKPVVIQAAVAEEPVQFHPVNHETKTEQKKKNPYAWIKWASLAAAGLLVVIMIPAVVGLGILGNATKDMASAETEAAVNDMYVTQDAVMEEVADMEMAEGAEEGYPSLDSEGGMFEESENAAVEETAPEEDIAEIGKETVAEGAESESVSGSEATSVLYGDMLVEGIPATVTGVISNFDRDYYNVFLTFEGEALELTDELFGDYECYNNGELEVRVYYDVTLQPEPGVKYIVTIYEVAEAAWGEEVIYVPCAAELSPEPYKQY